MPVYMVVIFCCCFFVPLVHIFFYRMLTPVLRVKNVNEKVSLICVNGF